LFRKEFWQHSERGDIACAIGHTAGHIHHIFKASAKDLIAGLSIAQLLVKGGSLTNPWRRRDTEPLLQPAEIQLG
jgi:hypothetical protein